MRSRLEISRPRIPFHKANGVNAVIVGEPGMRTPRSVLVVVVGEGVGGVGGGAFTGNCCGVGPACGGDGVRAGAHVGCDGMRMSRSVLVALVVVGEGAGAVAAVVLVRLRTHVAVLRIVP